MATSKKSTKQSEIITAQEIIANEPEVKETISVPELYKEAAEVDVVYTPLGVAVNGKLPQVDIEKWKDYVVPIEPPKEQTDEEKLLSFLDGKSGYVRVNEFFKSLYPFKLNEPPKFLQQHESRRWRDLLRTMQDAGKIKVKDNRHLQLGSHYYDEKTNVQKHRNLNDWPIEVSLP